MNIYGKKQVTVTAYCTDCTSK